MSEIVLREVTGAYEVGSAVVAEIQAIWRSAREGVLSFLLPIHGPEEEREYIAGVMLRTGRVFVADVEGARGVGFLSLRGDSVEQLYVDPANQNRGVGAALLGRAKELRERLELWAFEVNEGAIRFYRREGFRVVQRTDGEQNEAKRADVKLVWERGRE
ncbi:MAG TPA: GNAT family N-acetyltransferase [Tepidisphaeraceae bacterium]|nr:GNAT family N-acetyltransferase [Tepidisphaeraceae bacterium]